MLEKLTEQAYENQEKAKSYIKNGLENRQAYLKKPKTNIDVRVKKIQPKPRETLIMSIIEKNRKQALEPRVKPIDYSKD